LLRLSANACEKIKRKREKRKKRKGKENNGKERVGERKKMDEYFYIFL
jgi:hypothetical protein